MTPQDQLQPQIDPDLLAAFKDGSVPQRRQSRAFEKFQPGEASWSLDRLPQIQKDYQTQFGKPLPLANKGQGSIHNRWGYDHRNSADVSLSPTSAEGQWLSGYLKQNNSPFLSFDRAVPGVATGAHMHLGYPSSKTGQKFSVGAQVKGQSTPTVDPELLRAWRGDESQPSPVDTPPTTDLDPDLLAAWKGEAKTPQVTSSVREPDSNIELPSAEPITAKPIAFRQGTVAPENSVSLNPVENVYNELSKPDTSVRGVAGLQAKKYESPESRQLGDRVTLPISPHVTPSEDEVVNGYLSTLGPEYVKAGEQYKSQTGHSILTLGGGALKQDEQGRYYVRPSKGAVDFINTYVQSGGDLSKAMAEAQRQVDEHVAAENKAFTESKPDVAEAKAAQQTAKDSPVLRGMIRGTAGAAQAFGSVLPGSVGNEFERQAAVEKAASEQVDKDAPLTNTEDRIKAGIGGLIPTAAMLIATHKLGPAQLAALGILEGSTPQERIRGGLQGAAAQAVLGGAPAAFDEAGLPITGKAATSTAMVAQPAVEAWQRGESPVQAITENLPFAALPFLHGKGETKGGGNEGLDEASNRAGLGRRTDAVLPNGGTNPAVAADAIQGERVTTAPADTNIRQDTPSAAESIKDTEPQLKPIIRHSDPRIDGGEVVGRTGDGKLKVQNNEGGVSVVQNPRTQGNRDAAIVRSPKVEQATPFITPQMRADLADRGFSEAEIYRMPPSKAREILEQASQPASESSALAQPASDLPSVTPQGAAQVASIPENRSNTTIGEPLSVPDSSLKFFRLTTHDAQGQPIGTLDYVKDQDGEVHTVDSQINAATPTERQAIAATLDNEMRAREGNTGTSFGIPYVEGELPPTLPPSPVKSNVYDQPTELDSRPSRPRAQVQAELDTVTQRALDLNDQIRKAERISLASDLAIRKIQEDSLARNKAEAHDLRFKISSLRGELEPASAPVSPQPKEAVPQPETATPLNVISEGRESKASTERGTEVATKYAIVEAKDLSTSHDTLLNQNPDFPAELQPRERGRAASAEQINRIAQNLRPEYLGESPKASEGAPIVGPDGVVESGNGRVLGLRKAFESGKANSYRQYLLDNAETFGIDPKAIEGAKEPVLVRVRQSEVDRPRFVKEANESGIASMSAPEQAKSDGQKITGDLLSTFSPSESGEINTAQNTNFIRAFMRDVVGPNELGRYVGSKGEVSQEGLTRIRNAIFARAYGDSPEGLRALEKLSESPDNNVRSITTALLQRAGQFASLKEGIAKGERYPLDVTSDLSRALSKLSSLREQNTTVADYLNQKTLFEEDLTPLQKQALWAFDEYKRSGKAISAILDNYAKGAEAAGSPKQESFFDKEAPRKEELFDAAVREAINDSQRQTGLFAAENQGTKAESSARQPLSATDTTSAPAEPSIVRAARERSAKRAAEKQQGIEYRHAGADPYELVDSLIVRGWELYDQKVKPTFQEWSRKLREEFGPQANEHLRSVWAQLSGSEQTSQRQSDLPGVERPASDRVGIKNAITEAERESRGLDPIEKQMYDGVGDAVLKGKKAIEEGRIDPRSLAEERARHPRALTAEETGALAVYKANLVREQESALGKTEEAISKNDPKSLAEWRLREKDLDQQRDVLDSALERSGRDNSAALNARKALVDREDALVTVIRNARAAKGGEISPDVQRQLSEMTKEIESLKKKLAAKPERSADPVIRRIQDEVAREARRDKRALTKDDLDSEYKELSAQFGRLANRAHMGLDPEMVVLIGKIAKNRVRAGINTSAGLVDEIHSTLKDYARELSKDDIRDVLAGDKDKILAKREKQLTKQVADLESRIAKNELAAKERKPTAADNEKTAQLKAERDTLNGVLRDLRKQPRDPLATTKKRLAGSVLKLEDQINRGDFSKPERPNLLPDRETKDLQNRLADLRERRDKKIESLRKVNKWDMLARYTVGWSRAAKLMYTSTLGKLTSAATGRVVVTPVEEIWGVVPSKIFPELARRAPREANLNIGAEVRAISELFKSDVWKETWRKLSAGRTSEDIMYGGKKGDMEFLSLPGRVHGSFKEPARQVEQTRAFEKRLTHAAKNGVDISDPNVQLALYGEAYVDSNRAIFQQPNALSDGFNDVMRKWEKGSGIAKTGAHVGKFFFPITKVPVNIGSETANYTLGLPRAAFLTAKAYRNGFENLTPQQADSIMRSWKKGGVGLGMMMLGFFNPDKFGGYYQKHEKRKEGEPGPGEQKWFGVRIPKWAGHVPILEAAQLGATIRRVIDAKRDMGAFDASLEGGIAAGKGLAESVPFYETPARFFTGKEGSRGAAEMAGQQVRGMVPGFIQEGAQALDKGPTGQPVKRAADGTFSQRLGQTIELGIPKLRENVPINSVFGSQATKASDEAQRLKVDIKGAVKQPDESREEFKARESRVNPYIKRALEQTVAMPEYDKASDADKIEWLKQVRNAAAQEGQDNEPEKPEKPEKREFPIPSGAAPKQGFKSRFAAGAPKSPFKTRLMQSAP